MGGYVKQKDRGRIPGGPLARHGGYSVAHKDEILKRNPEIRRYLKVVRAGLIEDLAPEGEHYLTAARHCVLDRLMQKLATVRLVETYLAEYGILRRDRIAEKILEAEPITSLWLALNNQIREDLKLLGLERVKLEEKAVYPWEDEPGPVSQAEKEAIACPGASESDSDGQGDGSEGDDGQEGGS